MLAIETVAAGGGSMCRFDGVKLVVGPESAGADPGPAAYGRGGPLTVTDLNLPRRDPARTLSVPLDASAGRARLDELAADLGQRIGIRYSLHSWPRACCEWPTPHGQAVRAISVAKGFDPRDYVLVAFGGAAGQHACAIADELRYPGDPLPSRRRSPRAPTASAWPNWSDGGRSA